MLTRLLALLSLLMAKFRESLQTRDRRVLVPGAFALALGGLLVILLVVKLFPILLLLAIVGAVVGIGAAQSEVEPDLAQPAMGG